MAQERSKRVVYIGGFANDSRTAERVGQALSVYYADYDVFSFSDARSNPDAIRMAVARIDVVTHSAGMLPLRGTCPANIDAFSPPLPKALWRFPAASVRKRMRMHQQGVGLLKPADQQAVKAYERGTIREMLAHPWRNFSNLGTISRFDAVNAASAAAQFGINTRLVYTEGDEFFTLTDERAAAARAAGVAVRYILGVHDELPLRPEATLQAADYIANAE